MSHRLTAVLVILALAAGCDQKPAATTAPTSPPAPAAPTQQPAANKGPALPTHPDQLKYGKPSWEVPTADQHRSVLKNGMIVYAIEARSLPKTELSILMRAGSFWEAKGKEGLASM